MNWVKIQQSAAPEDQIIYSIVGWHALTLPQDPKVLKQSKLDMLATLLAIGIDPNASIVFHQDDVRKDLAIVCVGSAMISFAEPTPYGTGMDIELSFTYG